MSAAVGVYVPRCKYCILLLKLPLIMKYLITDNSRLGGCCSPINYVSNMLILSANSRS